MHCLTGEANSRQLVEQPARKPFDGSEACPLLCQSSLFGERMENSNEESPVAQIPPGQLPHLPQIWIGYLLGIATLAAEFVAVSFHPELAKGEDAIPPLYLFLAIFVGW